MRRLSGWAVIVSPKGEATVTTKGFAGSSCRDASKFVERALGQCTDERLSAEFHQAEPVELTHRQQT